MSAKLSLPQAEEIDNLIPIGRIAESTPYTSDFLRQLARSGRIRAFKFNRDWLTTREAVRAYIQEQQVRHEQMLVDLKSAERSLS